MPEERVIRPMQASMAQRREYRTDCMNCPCRKLQNKIKVPVYKANRQIGIATYQEVGFRGPKEAEVMIVGESPGSFELYRRAPFVGDSGELVTEAFEKHGIDAATFFFSNSTRCMLVKKEMKKAEIKQAMKCCRPAITHFIKKIRPKLLILFGDIALGQVMKQTGITKRRGQFVWSEEFGCFVLPTFHPAYCLRDQTKFAFWNPDIAQIADFIKRGFEKQTASAEEHYELIDSIDFLLEQEDFTVGFDTESQGLDYLDRNCLLLGYSVAPSAFEGYYVALLEETTAEEAEFFIKWPRALGRKKYLADVAVRRLPRYKEKIKELQQLMTRSDIKKIMLNGNHDLHFIEKIGIKRETVHSYTLDVQLAIQHLDPDAYSGASLLDVQRVLTPHRADHKTIMNKFKEDMISAPIEEVAKYAAADAASTYEGGVVARRHLLADPGKKLARYYAKFSHPVTSTVLFEIERNGIRFDMSRLPAATEQVVMYLNEKSRAALSFVPKAVLKAHMTKGLKLTRTDLIRDIMFSKKGFGITPAADGLTPGGVPSANQNLLKRLLDEVQDEPELEGFLENYLAWAPYQKLHSTYLKSLGRLVRSDGRIHPQISTIWTATGRTAMRKPNLQNIPKRKPEIATIVRALFIASPGKVLLSVDYSQSELRWIADWGRVRTFMRVFRNDEDIHTDTATGMVGEEAWATLTDKQKKEYRQKAKAVNFGFVYGMHGKKFKNYARDEYGVKMTQEEAEAYRHWFLYEKNPDIPIWHERDVAFARKHGYIRTAFGRIRRTPNINSDDFRIRSEDERIAINTSIQGPSSDGALLGALIARTNTEHCVIDNRIAKLVLFVHDELVVEVDEDRYEEVANGLKWALETGVPEALKTDFDYELRVPFKAEVSVGPNLANMVDFD